MFVRNLLHKIILSNDFKVFLTSALKSNLFTADFPKETTTTAREKMFDLKLASSHVIKMSIICCKTSVKGSPDQINLKLWSHVLYMADQLNMALFFQGTKNGHI